MLVGRPPFETANLEQTYAYVGAPLFIAWTTLALTCLQPLCAPSRKIRSNDYTFPAEVPLSTHARSLIRWLLQPRPSTCPNLFYIFYTRDADTGPSC